MTLFLLSISFHIYRYARVNHLLSNNNTLDTRETNVVNPSWWKLGFWSEVSQKKFPLSRKTSI